MRLASLRTVTFLNNQREDLLLQRALIADDKHHITVMSKYLDDAMVAIARPALLAEIDARVSRIDAQLRDLGVQLA